MKRTDPLRFFGKLKWVDGSPLMDVIEPYRRRIFTEALYALDEGKMPQYNLVVSGRSKKNWKSADLILAALYRLLAWQSTLGNECYIVANDAGQAADDLAIAKKLVRVNPLLSNEVRIKKNIIERRDGAGFLEVLPAGDIKGSHGKSYLFCGLDEIHEYRNWDLLEALTLDPHRPDALQWITSYASLYNFVGCPLFDLSLQGKSGQDPRMFFSWYAGDYSTDPEYAALPDPEARANPSTLPPGYLDQQRRRLPAHKFRRLHLNLGGAPSGAYFNAEKIEGAAIGKYQRQTYQRGRRYQGFIDMSGGSRDDATLAVSHAEEGRIVVDGVWDQGRRPPFDPRQAVSLFASILKEYNVSTAMGDKYAGETFIRDFEKEGIDYRVCEASKHELYEQLEIELNSGRVCLPDDPMLFRQLTMLVMRGGKIDHLSAEQDDYANSAAGAVYLHRQEHEMNIRCV